ncbi:LuxR C-terminal-related transcriptional regulator [Nesterenkonia haasae]|uniref:LuxR C-terminal-related transcriptional regulator n=1 Tax=Nesterenkonia haasae TaxID=2587813 RepID=UPI0013907A40|nr:LuxR C-terminal-related transcriptional regulator [Nesterenkonia haasae]NDK32355.1 hypothetical protein [Nesterenkonia haasae]
MDTASAVEAPSPKEPSNDLAGQRQNLTFHIPALAPDIPHRPRLTRHIEAHVAISGFAVILAPSGAGKTTAAAQWSREWPPGPVLWLDGEDSEGDSWSFFTDLIEELEHVLDVDFSDSVGDRQEPRPLRRMGTVLSRVLNRRKLPVDIIVDQAEHLSQSSLRLIAAIAERCPHVRFLILATHLDPSFVSTAKARLDAQVLPAEELQLTGDEVEQALGAAGLTTDDESVMASVTSPLMVRSLISYARRADQNQVTAAQAEQLSTDLRAQSTRRVLANAVLGADGEAMLLIGLVGIATPSLLTPLLGFTAEQSCTMLQHLEQLGIGTHDDGDIFRLESTLASGLKELAQERLTLEHLQRAHGVISDWFLQNERPWEAALHAERAGDWERVAKIVLLDVTTFPRSAQSAFRHMLSQVPADVMRRHPHLGWYRMLFMFGVATRPAMESAAAEIIAALDPEAEGLTKLVNMAVTFATYRVLGEYQKAETLLETLLPAVEQLQGLVGGDVEFLPPEQKVLVTALRGWIARALRTYAASTKMFLGDTASALRLIEPMVVSPVDVHGVFNWRKLFACGLKAMILAHSGNIIQARRVLEWIQSFDLPPGWDQAYAGAPAVIAQARVALADGRPETARAELDKVWLNHPTIDLWGFILELRAQIAMHFPKHGEVGFLATELESRHDRPPTSRYVQVTLLSRMATTAAAAGMTPTAERYLHQAREIDYPTRRSATLEQHEIMVEVCSERFASARQRSEALLQSRNLTPHQEMTLRLSWALAEYALLRQDGDTQASPLVAGDQLRAALALANECGTPYEVLIYSPSLTRSLLQDYAPDRRDLLTAIDERLAAAGREREASAHQPTVPELSDAEIRVLEELAHTGSRVVIAHRLYLSVNTIKSHLNRLYKKFGVHSRDAALEFAYSHHMLERNSDQEHSEGY